MSRRRPGGAAPQPAVPGTTPSVDLRSPWVLQERRVHLLRVRFACATGALLMVVALAWSAQQLRLTSVGRELAAEEAAGQRLAGRIDDLAAVEAYVGSVRRRAQLVQTTMYTEVSTARVLESLRAALPPGARLDAVTLELTATAEAEDPPSPTNDERARGVSATCPGPDPFGALTVVGCVVVNGTAPDRASVAALVRRLDREELFVEAFVSTTTVSEDSPLSFSGSVGLSPAAFTRRYDEVTETLTPTGTEGAS